MAEVVPIITAVASVFSVAKSAGIIGGGGGSGSPTVAAPAVTPPVTMPSPNDSNAALAQQKSESDQAARFGRTSTVLTADSGGDKLGS